MKVAYKRWWLLPVGILIMSAIVAVNILVFGLSFSVLTETDANRSAGVREADYAFYQQHYQNLVLESGVTAAFDELKNEYTKDAFVSSQCHQLTHVIGRAAFDLYGDLPYTYSQGDPFCASGYYHGAMEAVVAKIGADRILEEADLICADLAEGQKYSVSHFSCVHGLGHGFMALQENELFESLQTCDTLTGKWEKESCYSGTFMENIMASDNPNYPSKYLKADQPLYPCTDVKLQYKEMCYQIQTSYALRVLEYDFAKVFDLCATTAEEDLRPMCYQSLGRDAFDQVLGEDASNQTGGDMSVAKTICLLGRDYEARSNCAVGAAKAFIYHYHNDTQAKAFCESFDADVRDVCLQAGKEYYKTFQV